MGADDAEDERCDFVLAEPIDFCFSGCIEENVCRGSGNRAFSARVIHVLRCPTAVRLIVFVSVSLTPCFWQLFVTCLLQNDCVLFLLSHLVIRLQANQFFH